MSNSDLKAEVSRLQGILNGIERENQALKAEIGTAVGAVNAANSNLGATRDHINSTLGSANSTLRSAHQRVIAAYETQQEIDGIYQRLKNMELANKNIRACNNTKYYDFEVYRKVRKIVQGIMDNLDFSMISDETIEKAVEKKQLAEPDFWLTPALVSVCAWCDDQRERAGRALARALDLDEKKTASFMLVFNLRLGREDAAFKWFDLLVQLPMMGSDKYMMLLFFSLLSRTIEDKVSDAAHNRVSTYMRRLITDEIESSDISRNMAVERIVRAFNSSASNFSFTYNAIAKHAANAQDLRRALALARNTAAIIDFITFIMDVSEDTRNEYLKTYVDHIVEEPCATEASVYDEIERNEMIIKYQGDLETAQQAYDELKQHDESAFDIVAEMIGWVYTAEGRSEANPQMRRNMLLLTSELQQLAADAYIDQYRGLFSPLTTVTIDEFSGTCTLADPDVTKGAVVDFHHQRAAEQKAAVKNTAAYISLVVAILFVVAAMALSPVLAVGAVLALGAGGAILLMNSSKRKRIDLATEQSIRNAEGVLDELGAEYKKLEKEFYEEDLMAAKLQAKMASL